MKRALTIGELLTILMVVAIPTLGWVLSLALDVRENETNIDNMQKVNVELLKESKKQSEILTNIRIDFANKTN